MTRLALLLLLLLPALARADEFLAGYVTGLLEAHVPELALGVQETRPDGTVVLTGSACPVPEQRERVTRLLIDRPGVRALEWNLACEVAPAPEPVRVETLPLGVVFQPLRADPREPQFSVRYQHHEVDGESFNAGDVSFGGYFALAEGRSGQTSSQLGIQGAVFALFNLDAPSHDLVNADYWIGLPYSWRRGRWSARARIYHQSSHLGDEFLLGRPEIERVNLSYEALDGLLAYTWRNTRVYAGGGYVVHSEPDLAPWLAQAGVEQTFPNLLGEADLVLAADLRASEEQSWELNRSYRAGLVMDRRGRELGLFLEHYRGFSPNGQFFTEHLRYTGIGFFFEM